MHRWTFKIVGVGIDKRKSAKNQPFHTWNIYIYTRFFTFYPEQDHRYRFHSHFHIFILTCASTQMNEEPWKKICWKFWRISCRPLHTVQLASWITRKVVAIFQTECKGPDPSRKTRRSNASSPEEFRKNGNDKRATLDDFLTLEIWKMPTGEFVAHIRTYVFPIIREFYTRGPCVHPVFY